MEKRNFMINVLEGALFIAGATFISVHTVLPSLVFRLGGGNVAVGALGVMAWGGLFLPQVFAARHVESLEWKKPWTIRLGLFARLIVGLISLVILSLAGSQPSVALALLLSFYGLMQVVLGITTPGWIDLVAKVTSVTRRGRLAGFRSSLAGGMGFGCSFVLAYLLSSFSFPDNYALAFGAAFVFQMISLAVQMRVVEATPSQVSSKKSMREFLGEIMDVLRTHHNFTRFIVAMAFLVLGTISVPFFTVHALASFGADALSVGRFTTIMVGAQVVASPLVGYLADRSGNRITLIVAASMLLIASLWAAVAPTLNWYYPVFVLLGANLGSEVMARYNIAVEFAPEKRRAVYLGMVNGILAPCYAVGMLGGWLSDHFGYHVVFIIGSLCSLVGMVLMIRNVKDPRLIMHTTPSPG
jgi:MFS family permease